MDISAVVFRDNAGIWIAQCLEHDVCAQADGPERVINELRIELVDQNLLWPVAELPQAPEFYRDLYERESNIPMGSVTANQFTVSLRGCVTEVARETDG